MNRTRFFDTLRVAREFKKRGHGVALRLVMLTLYQLAWTEGYCRRWGESSGLDK